MTPPHPHIKDAPEVRRYLLEWFGTDFGVDDDYLAQHAERAKVYLAFTDSTWSWQSVAANGVWLSHRGPIAQATQRP